MGLTQSAKSKLGLDKIESSFDVRTRGTLSQKEQRTVKKGVTKFMVLIIAFVCVVMVVAFFGFVNSAALINGGVRSSNLPTSYKKAAKGLGAFYIVLLAVTVGFGGYILYAALHYEKHNKATISKLFHGGGQTGWQAQGGVAMNHEELDGSADTDEAQQPAYIPAGSGRALPSQRQQPYASSQTVEPSLFDL